MLRKDVKSTLYNLEILIDSLDKGLPEITKEENMQHRLERCLLTLAKEIHDLRVEVHDVYGYVDKLDDDIRGYDP